MKTNLKTNGQKMMKYLLSFSLLTLIYFNSEGQDIQRFVFSSAGQTDSTAEYSVAWTLGEALSGNFDSQNFLINQGFQQETYLISPFGIQDEIPFVVKFYPNPVVDFVKIRIEKEDPADTYTIQFEDMSGKNLRQEEIFSNKEVSIDLRNIPSGTMILKVFNSKTRSCRIFKIVKVNPN